MKAVFLDKDGTLVRDKNYSYKMEDVEFLPGVFPALFGLRKNGYSLFIVSNQSGVERGYFTEQDITKVFDLIVNEFGRRGIEIKGYSYCPHKPKDNCGCRKPKTSMVEELIRAYKIKREESFFIGDKITDVETGKNANLRTILIGNENICREHEIKPDFVAIDLNQASRIIANLK